MDRNEFRKLQLSEYPFVELKSRAACHLQNRNLLSVARGHLLHRSAEAFEDFARFGIGTKDSLV
jgi:hypothetical protein